ncbi:MAG: cobyrinic acid a,c-diamide synthase [Roseofilum sp. SBFL]|nr:cobyrinic acid a,c-diamide synthase [Roseofilum sp. SID3]MBP0026610.1 cobyrinic acid a,c-diamide synthase [Roseofilum sp. SID2]MBP0036942.1 cobyrinic acid a,c-diamide synthase [Roseofilum sp. SID1]MBP0042089.1 cobyrinic acid a,c-diamide synthase [Roseofilum sp. SBFL]
MMIAPLPIMQSILSQLPSEARQWTEGLSWQQRRYVLSLCHLLLSAPSEVQAEFLDEYTADGIVAKLVQDQKTKEKVEHYLQIFQIPRVLNEKQLRIYIRQFYIHSAHDLRCEPQIFLESVLQLVVDPQEKKNVFTYTLGFELLLMMFRMSWLQHERLYLMQINQEWFLQTYIKPIQYTHKINHIITPKDERLFFAKRNFFVQKPEVSDKKAWELVMATFKTETVTNLGFSVIRHHNAFIFDSDYIFSEEEEIETPLMSAVSLRESRSL